MHMTHIPYVRSKQWFRNAWVCIRQSKQCSYISEIPLTALPEAYKTEFSDDNQHYTGFIFKYGANSIFAKRIYVGNRQNVLKLLKQTQEIKLTVERTEKEELGQEELWQRGLQNI
ncbi:uncharacterized protein LOC119738442 [Patiria miniata]|uniref:Uncharacterized protein n=1 Tax=Patiria miniata TaxID=46514 RepID=A0A914AHC1_PATMI|nr:uncharacterized protein LOC119733819 [Patiria miniata]XP_038067289.1 uncharacterized protein LOC119737184 [Patiria miniata]XP_038067314.1 uncharacterized protein LOC119737203 [Patiria miniata]XP_038067328.1 uncharacterized protein LOC119737215 [Patiria miniata]XP_038069267.1 uncharacterized protein LOC119738442 [Patiria miniata]